jgi:single-strand DNA-binding protein
MSDSITITGNIATAPELKRTPNGVTITTFRVASALRRYDRATGTWVDAGTNWYTVSAFRGLAEHAYDSLHRGDRVLLTGRLRLREWENGAKRGLSVEIDAEAIGHDLLWGTSTFVKSSQSSTADREKDWGGPGESDAWAAPGIGIDPANPPALSALPSLGGHGNRVVSGDEPNDPDAGAEAEPESQDRVGAEVPF